MGGNYSNLVPKPPDFDYMSITFRYSDKVCLIYATSQEITLVRDVIMQNWKKGIQSEETKLGCDYVFKLHGTPYCQHSSEEEAINCKKLANHLLYRLHNQGLKLVTSSDLTQTVDFTTWIFHREQTIPAQFPLACIGVSSWDKLQCIDFPSNMHELLKSIVERNWPKTIQGTKLIGDTFDIKLKGNPWNTLGGSENIQSKSLIKALVNELSRRQWVLYGSSNLRGNADTLFFMYNPSHPTDSAESIGFIISLNKNDRLRTIDAPKDVTDNVRNSIATYWRRGIQNEKQNLNAYEFKLSGTPWWADGEQAVDSRHLICKILEGLHTIGWKAKTSIDLSRKINDKSVLAFERCLPNPTPVFCLSLNWTDKIRFINAPADVVKALTDEVKRIWSFGVSRERLYGASTELKLNENPWSYGFTGHDGAHGRVLLTYLLKLCANMGWYLILSADISAKFVHQENGPDYPIDVHSWWFMKVAPPQPQDMMGIPPPQYAPPLYGMDGQPPPSYWGATAPGQQPIYPTLP